jgi:hypothetical protein
LPSKWAQHRSRSVASRCVAIYFTSSRMLKRKRQQLLEEFRLLSSFISWPTQIKETNHEKHDIQTGLSKSRTEAECLFISTLQH